MVPGRRLVPCADGLTIERRALASSEPLSFAVVDDGGEVVALAVVVRSAQRLFRPCFWVHAAGFFTASAQRVEGGPAEVLFEGRFEHAELRKDGVCCTQGKGDDGGVTLYACVPCTVRRP
jgi:hypothetical protein